MKLITAEEAQRWIDSMQAATPFPDDSAFFALAQTVIALWDTLPNPDKLERIDKYTGTLGSNVARVGPTYLLQCAERIRKLLKEAKE